MTRGNKKGKAVKAWAVIPRAEWRHPTGGVIRISSYIVSTMKRALEIAQKGAAFNCDVVPVEIREIKTKRKK